MKGLRGERLASEFQKAIYEVISRKLRDRNPQLSAIISVTGADVAPDLKTAKIYVSIFDPSEEKSSPRLKSSKRTPALSATSFRICSA